MDWARAWQGVSNIFGGILHGLKSIAKGAINGVIGIINAGISGLNKLKAPDWVPGIGGKSPNIPLIPQLAKGINYFKGGLAVVGEEGPELVNLPRGSQVIPNNKTKQMLAPLYTSKIAEPAIGQLQGTVTYGSEFTPPEIMPLKGRAIYDEQAHWKTSESSIDYRPRRSTGDTFILNSEINVTIDGNSNDVKQDIPNIKREIKKAIVPTLEDYFYQLQLKRPAITKV